MTGDTFTERRGYVKKSSGVGGSIALIVGIGLLVGGAGVAGLHYAATHGWDQPAPQGTSATDPLATEAPTTAAAPNATDLTETTAADVPATAASATAAPEPAPAEEQKPKPKPYIAPHPKPKSDSNSASDPFATQQ